MISIIDQFSKTPKMRYCDALKCSITSFSDKTLKEPESSINECNYASFRPVMIIIEHPMAGPKTILSGSAIIMLMAIMLKYYFLNLQNLMRYPITSSEVQALEPSFNNGSKLISHFPTYVKAFDSNANQKLRINVMMQYIPIIQENK
jgi:hypothetical protein